MRSRPDRPAAPLPFVPPHIADHPTLTTRRGSRLSRPARAARARCPGAAARRGPAQRGGSRVERQRHLDHAALDRARAFLDTERSIVRSADLEAVSGLSRFELARQFRARFGTSPYRYSLVRRLDLARRELHQQRLPLPTSR